MSFEMFSRFGALRFSAILVLSAFSVAEAQTSEKNAGPVTDLSALELHKPIGTNVRNLAEVTYTSDSTVQDAYSFHEKQLKAAGLAAKPGGMVTEQYASAIYQGSGDRISLMVFPGGGKGVSVMLANQGNVDLAGLPVPDGTKKLFEGPSNILFVTDKTVDDARETIRSKLIDSGWHAYGEAGPIVFFKQGSILVQAMIQAAPAQGGKTVIDYQSRRLSADIDAPEGATRLAYAESTKSLDVDTKLGLKEAADSFRKTLETKGWKPTTDKPVQERFEQFWIFRNDGKELIELKMRKLGEGTRILAKFMTSKEVEEETKKAEAAARKAMKKGKPDSKAVSIEKPGTGIESWTVTSQEIKAVAKSGQARKSAEAIRDRLKSKGWSVSVQVTEDIAGSISMEQEDLSVSIVYDDTGVTPAELTITIFGAKFAAGDSK